MFQDHQLFDEFIDDQLKLTSADRESLKTWAEKWLVDQAVKNPGTWVDSFRPQLMELMAQIEIGTPNGHPQLKSPAALASTLTLLARGSRWFNGVDQLELELLGVVMTTR